MCGIVGVINSPQALGEERIRLFFTLMKLNTVRGCSAIGIMTDTGKPIRLEAPNGWDESVEDDLRAHFKELATHKAIFGHTRAPTNGDITLDQCHPICHGLVAVGHNGILHNHRELRTTYKVPAKYPDLDTFIIAYLLNHFLREDSGELVPIGVFPSLKFTNNLLQGSYAYWVRMLHYVGITRNISSVWVRQSDHSEFVFSSEKFLGSTLMPNGSMYLIDLRDGALKRDSFAGYSPYTV